MNLLAVGITEAAVETVVVIGKKCGDSSCKEGPFYDQTTDYDPLAGPVGKGGGNPVEAALNAWAAAFKEPCAKAGETQNVYTSRAVAEGTRALISSLPSIGFDATERGAQLACEARRSDFVEKWSTGSIPAC